MAVNKKKQTGPPAKPNRKLTFTIACSAVVVLLLLLAGLHAKNAADQLVHKAQTANTVGLNELILPGTTELGHQNELHCSRSGLDKKRCTAQETRVYALQAGVDSFEVAMSKALAVHGWSSNTVVTSGYFFHTAKPSPVVASADVARLAYGDNASRPLQSNISIAVLNKVPYSDGRPAYGTAFSYTDTKLKQKFTDIIGSGDLLLVITSYTGYTAWL